MARSRPDRLPWEYADGLVVGRDVEITSPRRDEQPVHEGQSDSSSVRTDGVEEREVRSEDPELSAETNARVTDELREVVGADTVNVPSSRPRAARGDDPRQQTAGAFLSMHRFQLIRATAIVLTFAAIIALITTDWWLLPLAAGLHALGTMTVTLTIIHMTTATEHPSPEVAAAMAEDGITNPDEHFSKMVDEFREEREGGAAEVISPGHNERSADASATPADAAAEQSSAMTPTSQPSKPSGQGGMPDVVIWTTTAALFVLSIVLPAALGGGWLWLLTAVMVPLLAGWAVLQRTMVTRPDHVDIHGRAPLIAIAVCTALAVAFFCAVVAIAFQR